ncbi:unnamed protein product [Periconia digitata]|uniref:Uncharacterized protein n=1 Tax=Periconia digitata TaxID=1303443 RepID=A0A9W4XJ66_9PLEO|nr:unnamed protein product [Periconia digitata]
MFCLSTKRNTHTHLFLLRELMDAQFEIKGGSTHKISCRLAAGSGLIRGHTFHFASHRRRLSILYDRRV